MKLYIIIALTLISTLGAAQAPKEVKEVNVKVVELSSNDLQDVVMANVYVEELDQEFQTDISGFVSLPLTKGTYTLYISALGLDEQRVNLTVSSSAFELVQLEPVSTASLAGLEVRAER